jgi:hypothetical protein
MYFQGVYKKIWSELTHTLESGIDVTPGPSKLEMVVDPGSGPRGSLPKFCQN